MPDTKITALTALTAADPANDVLPIVDVSDTTMAASGTTKKISINNVLGCSGTATLASATITGDLTVDTNTLKVTASTDTVTVGATTTDAKFRVVDANYNGLRIGFLPGTANYNLYDATVHEFRTANVTPQQLYTLQASSSVWYDGAGGTRMTLNSTGLGVGKAPLARLDVASTRAASVIGGIVGTTGTGVVNDECQFLIKNVNTASGQNNGAGIGGLLEASASNKSSLLFYVDNGTAVTNVGRFDSNGNLGIGVTPAGTGGCLQLKSGITFPATQVASSDANTLDDYEEGTFTPTVVGSTSAGTGTYSAQNGRYTKVGRLVTVEVDVAWSAHTGTGNMLLGGLPFTTNSTVYSSVAFGYVHNIALTAGNILTGYTGLASSTINLYQTPTGGGGAAPVPIDTAGQILYSVTYSV